MVLQSKIGMAHCHTSAAFCVAGTVLGKGNICFEGRRGTWLKQWKCFEGRRCTWLKRHSTWLALGKFIDNIDKRQVSLKLVSVSQKPQSSKGPLRDL